jgi:hypothetical protein
VKYLLEWLREFFRIMMLAQLLLKAFLSLKFYEHSILNDCTNTKKLSVLWIWLEPLLRKWTAVMRDIEGFSNKVKELCCVKAIPVSGVHDNRRVRYADNVFTAVRLYIIRPRCFPHSRGHAYRFTTQHDISFEHQIVSDEWKNR